MPDHATSSDPAVQAQLDRLAQLSPGRDILGLERITQIVARIGDPHHALPPVFHVAGTNGKGSTCAFLRAALEADGKSVHVFTSPHLVRFNERIRLNGTLIDDTRLAHYLKLVLDKAGDIGASFFEVTTAAAFLAFAEHPADALVLEVGLGGRLDATNIIENPAVCGIAQLGIDHQAFLGNSLLEIAAEKAGIAKPGVPVITIKYPEQVAATIERAIGARGGRWMPMGREWDAAPYRGQLHYRDGAGRVSTPLPRLPGPHQPLNAALAIAMLRHQDVVPVSEAAIKAAPLWAQWPARLQQLGNGPLLAALKPETQVWLDGGHNPAAGEMLGDFFRLRGTPENSLHLIIGMLENKDVAGFLMPLRGIIGHIHAVPVPGHAHHDNATFAAIASAWNIGFSAHDGPQAAISAVASAVENDPHAVLLIGGSLYLAGTILQLNEQLPD